MTIIVLRLGHRIVRDKRITTHVCLAARALGADGVILSGEKDSSVISSVEKIIERWGGKFSIEYERNWRKIIKDKKEKGWEIVHLTMYGERIQDKIQSIRNSGKDKLIIVGGEKVPFEVYEEANYNIAVTNQPHSEVAALAICLHEIFEGKELDKEFEGGHIRLEPSERSKKIINLP